MEANIPKHLRPVRTQLVRSALKKFDITSGIIDMSFIGNSVVHLLVDDNKRKYIEDQLTKHTLLLPNFDPLTLPTHLTQDANEATITALQVDAREFCIRRLAVLLKRSGPTKRAGVLQDFPTAIQTAALETAGLTANTYPQRNFNLNSFLPRHQQQPTPPNLSSQNNMETNV
ncbi:hypothetical protein BC829DRAFT_421745 [Chytridium lagenaria]|nr:hypothetical protein BC829DRAFT_421745 [Chytridium lagenaria]